MKILLIILLVAIITSTPLKGIRSWHRWDICLHGKRPPVRKQQREKILNMLEKNGSLAKLKNVLIVSGIEAAQKDCLKLHFDICDCRWIVEYANKN